MTDETRRINQARFTRSASEYAASRVTARREQIEALMALASPAAHDRVLDVACGPGALLATLAPRVRRTVGLDLTPAMLQLAQAAAPKAWCVRGAAERLPFDDGAFSLVVCTWAFHHFASPPRVLREMTRVCAPGGRVVVGDLVGSEDDAARARQNAVERLRDPAHVELDSGSGLARLLGAAGLAVGGTTNGEEARDLEQWCRMAGTPPEVADRLRSMLLAGASGELAWMSPSDVDGRLVFVHRWAMVRATKP